MSKTKAKYSWASTILTSLVIVLLGLIINSVNMFGSIANSKRLLIYVNVAYLIFSLILILVTIRINNAKGKVAKNIYTIILMLFVVGSSYGFYLVNIVDANIKNITSQEHTIKYESSFVIKKNAYQELEELQDKTIGLIESSEFIEGNVLANDELEKLEYDEVIKKTYSSYPLLINALVKDEVDFIALPKEYQTLFMTDENVSDKLSGLDSIHTFSGRYQNISKISGSDIDVSKVPFTVLLMGNDGGRTDSLILASVNPAAMQITLTSVARDSYVPIACYPNEGRDKINHARQVSRDCTIKSVENLLDLSIDFFVEVSFQGLVDLVDALGTLPIDSPAAFHGNVISEEGGGVFIPEGLSDLNGDQVLAFVRERYSFIEGDFQRQKNQQQVIDALITKIVETRDVNKLVNLIKATGQNVDTNMSVNQLIDLMNMAIIRMESTYLNSADIFTIYGNRITGRGVMIYTPDYGQDIYYYLPFNGSIDDAKSLIAMNTRADGILEIPEGFNYSYLAEYIPPTFGQLEYYEPIDDDIAGNINTPPPTPPVEEDPEIEEEELVTLPEFKNKRLSELDSFFVKNNLKYSIVERDIVETEDESLYNVEIVLSETLNVKLDNEYVLPIRIKEYVEKVKENGNGEEPPVEDPDEDDNDQ